MEEDYCNEGLCPVCTDNEGNVYSANEIINSTLCQECMCDENWNIVCQDKDENIVDGEWQEWGEWSECSLLCNQGAIRRRTRQCSNPMPQCGGDSCEGVTTETEPCTMDSECQLDNLNITDAGNQACGEGEVLITDPSWECTCDTYDECPATLTANLCVCENGTMRNALGECVTLEECTEQCLVDGEIREGTWDDPINQCLHYECVDGNVVTHDQADLCNITGPQDCYPNEYIAPDPMSGECCGTCGAPLVPSEECQLTTSAAEVKTFTLSDGASCLSDLPIAVTYCQGACSSYDRGEFIMVDTGELIRHDEECTCCQGTGDIVTYGATCDNGDAISFAIRQMNFCQCNACLNTGD